MKKLFSSENADILLTEDKKVLVYRFIGDIEDETYFEIWRKVFELTFEKGVKKHLVDQSQVGKISFRARGKVILKHLPAFKKEIGADFKTAIVTSKSIVNKSGVTYMVKAFKALFSSINTEFFEEERERLLNGFPTIYKLKKRTNQ